MAFKHARALCGDWPHEVVTPRCLRLLSSTLPDHPSACVAPHLGQEERVNKLTCAWYCPSVGTKLLAVRKAKLSLVELTDQH